GVDNRLSVYERGAFHLIDRSDGAPLGAIRAMTEDREGHVWAMALGNPQRVIRITDFSVREDIPVAEAEKAAPPAADAEEGSGAGLYSGDVGRYRDGQRETFGFAEGRPVRHVVVTRDGAVLGATGRGVVAWRNGTLRTLTSRNGLPCDGVYAAVF